MALHRRWKASTRHFLRDTRGSAAIVTGLTITILLGIAGLGIDASTWRASAHNLQTMAQATALSSARLLGSSSQTASSITAAAGNVALLNGFASTSDTIAVSFGPAGAQPPAASTVTVTVTRTLPRFLSTAFLAANPVVTATATAGYKAPGACFYMVDAVNAQALLVNSGFTLDAPNCQINVASKSTSAAIFNSGAKLNVKKTCIAGTVINNGATIGGLQTNCAVATDPYKGKLPTPTVGGCDVNTTNYSGSVTLTKGVYCGGFNFNGSGTLNLSPGLYVLKGSIWNINSGWVVNGTGVTFYFADSNSHINFNSNVTASLAAPTSGTYANLLIFEPDGLSSNNVTINGASTTGHALEGVVYLPSRNVTFNANYSGTADTFAMVANRIIFNSNSPKSWAVSPLGASGAGGVTLVN